MNAEQAGQLVDRWAKDWRKYLDGQLHKLPRQALVDAIVAATATADGDDVSEDLEGRPFRDDDVKAVARRVFADAATRRQANTTASDAAGVSTPGATIAAASDPDAIDLARLRDALTIMQADAEKRPLTLTPGQVERFGRRGLLAGVSYVVDGGDMPTDGAMEEQPRRRGRPPGGKQSR